MSVVGETEVLVVCVMVEGELVQEILRSIIKHYKMRVLKKKVKK